MQRNIIIALICTLFSCSHEDDTLPKNDKFSITNDFLSDKSAAEQVIELYKYIQQSADSGIILGHHESTAYGVGWWSNLKDNTSDIKKVTGYMPALIGWDFSGIDLGRDNVIDGVSVDDVVYHVRQAYKMGAINTFCWHANNPVTRNDSWTVDKTTVGNILPKGSNYKDFRQMVVRIASFIVRLKDDQGPPIPILFRPWHEHTGNWFWWGKESCSADEFKSLWRNTVKLLRDTLNMHNMLYVYSPGSVNNATEYMERYPGDDYVDVLGFDEYWWNDDSYHSIMTRNIDIIKDLASQHKKLYAITETGKEGVDDEKWFTSKLYPIIQNKGLSYIMFWRNANEKHHYVPCPGDISAEDFREFVNKDDIIKIKN